MTQIRTELAVGAAVRESRAQAGLTVAGLAERSGVSRAMIARIEREEVQPTAALLGRLSGALGVTLSRLVARAEQPRSPVARRSEQPAWVDPASGYRRRALSPQPADGLELVEIELPGDTVIGYPREASLTTHQQVWVLDGALTVREEEVEHQLEAGDCLSLAPDRAREYASEAGCRYLLAYAR